MNIYVCDAQDSEGITQELTFHKTLSGANRAAASFILNNEVKVFFDNEPQEGFEHVYEFWDESVDPDSPECIASEEQFLIFHQWHAYEELKQLFAKEEYNEVVDQYLSFCLDHEYEYGFKVDVFEAELQE